MTKTKDPDDYAGEPVCPRCGDGWPICASRPKDGRIYSHEETCQKYQWGNDQCAACYAYDEANPE